MEVVGGCWGGAGCPELSLERVVSPGVPGSSHPSSVNNKVRGKLLELQHEGF